MVVIYRTLRHNLNFTVDDVFCSECDNLIENSFFHVVDHKKTRERSDPRTVEYCLCQQCALKAKKQNVRFKGIVREMRYIAIFKDIPDDYNDYIQLFFLPPSLKSTSEMNAWEAAYDKKTRSVSNDKDFAWRSKRKDYRIDISVDGYIGKQDFGQEKISDFELLKCNDQRLIKSRQCEAIEFFDDIKTRKPIIPEKIEYKNKRLVYEK